MSVEPDWEAIRRDYGDLGLSLRDIYSKHGIDQSSLYARRRAEGWTPRPSATDMRDILALRRAARIPADIAAAVAEPPAEPASAGGQPRSPASLPEPAKPRPFTLAQRRLLVARITRAIDIKLQVLERRFEHEMHKEKFASSADTERDMRAIAQLIKNLEQVAAYAHAETPSSSIRGAAAKSAADAAVAARQLADQADRVRHELGLRLQRFVDAAQSGAGGDPGGDRTPAAD